MSEPIRVAILGFTAAERSALSQNFTLAAKRTPRYDIVLGIDDARFVIADADQSGTAELLRELGRTGDALFVGAQAVAGAAGWLPRPSDPVLVMRELDALLLGHPQASAPAAPPTEAPREPTPEAQREAHLARKRQREAALRPVPLRRALLVDDSEIALHFLDRQLAPYGLDTDYAHESDRALELLAHQRYGFVFVDLDLGEASPLDGLALCQRIKQQARPAAGAPLVIIVSAFHDPVDRVRGTLAGADAYLGKPLDLEVLDRLLRQHGLSSHAGARKGPDG